MDATHNSVYVETSIPSFRMVNCELGLATPVLATPLNFGRTEGTSDE